MHAYEIRFKYNAIIAQINQIFFIVISWLQSIIAEIAKIGFRFVPPDFFCQRRQRINNLIVASKKRNHEFTNSRI